MPDEEEYSEPTELEALRAWVKELEARLGANAARPSTAMIRLGVVKKEGRKELTEREECGICFEAKRSCAFQPCIHLFACDVCSKLLDECPCCRGKVEGRILRIKLP